MLFKEIELSNSVLNWAEFFLNIGRLYGEKIINDTNSHNLIIKVPYTNFIPQIISLGCADQIYSIDEDSNVDLKAILEPGMTIYYRTSPNYPERPYIFLKYNEEGIPIIKEMRKNPVKITVGKYWEENTRIAPEQKIYKKGRALKNKNLSKLKAYYSEERLERLAQSNSYKVIIIGNEKKLKLESEVKVENLSFYSWLLMRPFLHQQSYYLTNIYSSKYKGELEELPENTLIIYSTLDAFYHFYEELNQFSSIVLYSPFEKSSQEIQVLSTIADYLDTYDKSEIIELAIAEKLPKGVEIATWIID